MVKSSLSSSKVENEAMVSVHYQKALEIIINLLKRLKTRSSFYIFFDEFDEGYTAGDANLNLLLLALLRSTENCFLDLKKLYKIYPYTCFKV